MLSGDTYLLEGLQSADKTKMHPKAKLQNAPTCIRNGIYSRVCLLLVIKIRSCTYNCVSDNQPIPIISAFLFIITVP